MMPEITEDVRQRIAEVIAHADAHPLESTELMKPDPRWKDTVQIAPGFVAIFTIEIWPRYAFRHLSVRQDGGATVVHPSDEALTAIMREFGYSKPLGEYTRALGPNAKHVIEEIALR